MYKLKKAIVEFDDEGKVKTITCTAEMPGNSSDVRTIEARGANHYWKPKFQQWEPQIQEIMQRVTGHGSEI